MSLRVQLCLVSLSVLVLPWAVFLFILELDRNLLESQAKSSGAQSALISTRLAGNQYWRTARVRPASKTLLATTLGNPVLLDGYDPDWSAVELSPREFQYAQNKVAFEQSDLTEAAGFSVLPALRDGWLYLFIRVTDGNLVYHDPLSNILASGDNLIVRVLTEDGSVRRYTFRFAAPGESIGRYLGPPFEGERPELSDIEYKAVLSESAIGYDIEVRMPQPLQGQFALTIVDIDETGGVERWTGMFDPGEQDDVGQLKFANEDFTELLKNYTDKGMRLRVFDGQGWLVADSDRRVPDADLREFKATTANLFDAMLFRFVSWSLEQQIGIDKLPGIDDGKLGKHEFDLLEHLTSGAQYLRDRYGRVFLTSVEKIASDDEVSGYLLMQYPRASMTAFTEAAILRLVKIFGAAVLFVTFILLLFASFLSWRVRKLRDSIESAVSSEGKVTESFRISTAPDEIGDLGRSFRGITTRLSNYTSYLQTLGSRLSHELRTPLSVVTTSLESIDENDLDERTRIAVERAGEGAGRLQQLIRNLSEASSLEQTITRSEKEIVEVREWMAVARELYDSIYSNRKISLHVNCHEHATIWASVELLHQMMDKLMSNAVDFSEPGSVVELVLRCTRNAAIVSVENTGMPLPAAMASELFEPMVTERNFRDDQPHMGLGLYIVKLIADYHSAVVSAENIPSRRAVRFSVEFPLLGIE